jgi:ubiquinone/menaquinone biosynthesis C-methylase UbiE
MVPALFATYAASLIAQAALQPGERVLDAACGTGIVPRMAAPHVGETGHVTGLDLNAGMLEVARKGPTLHGAPITWQEGNLEALPFGEATFDVVLCQQGLSSVRIVLRRSARCAEFCGEMDGSCAACGGACPTTPICRPWCRLSHNT